MAKRKLKVRKFRGGGMDASKADFKTPSSKKGPPANIGGNNNQVTASKNNVVQNIGGNNNPITKTYRP